MNDISTKAMDEVLGLTEETRFYIVDEFANICRKFTAAIEGKDIEALKDELWRVSALMRRLMP